MNSTKQNEVSMDKRIKTAEMMVAKAEGTEDGKAWHKAALKCLAVVNNTMNYDLARRFNNLYETCTTYARHYR